MYLFYIDESGDTGLQNSPTKYFILTGIVFHELRWKQILEDAVKFRRLIKQQYGLKVREEIHASAFINNPGKLLRISKNDRVAILKKCIHWLSFQKDINIITVVVNKQGKQTDIFELAWSALIQRFENTIRYKNFPGPSNSDDKGMVLPDNTDGEKLAQLIRKMRHYNIIPNRYDLYPGGARNLTLDYVIEDPFMKDSRNSLINQFADVIAYFARQKYEPNAYLKKKAGIGYYDKLEPVLCKVTTKNHPLGIVEL